MHFESDSSPLQPQQQQRSSPLASKPLDRTGSVDRLRSSLALKYSMQTGEAMTDLGNDDEDEQDVEEELFSGFSSRLFFFSGAAASTTKTSTAPTTAKSNSVTPPVSRKLQLADESAISPLVDLGTISTAKRINKDEENQDGLRLVITMMCWILDDTEAKRSINDCSFLLEIPPNADLDEISAEDLEARIAAKARKVCSPSSSASASSCCSCTAGHSLYLYRHNNNNSSSSNSSGGNSPGDSGDLFFISSFTVSIVAFLERKGALSGKENPEIYVFPASVTGMDI